MKHTRTSLTLLVALTACAPLAIAQDEQGEPAGAIEEQAITTQSQPGDRSTVAGVIMQGPASGPSVTIRGSYRLQFESDFDEVLGDFSVNRALLGFTVADAISETISYSLDFQFEHSAYDFHSAPTLAPGTTDPLDEALSFSFTPSFRFASSEDWAVRLGGALFISGESNADVADSIRGSIFGGVEHKISDKLTMSVLIVVWSRLEDDPTIFPFIGVSWQINELMRLQTRGLGAEFISDLGNGWSLGARAAWEYREFRLNDDTSAPLPNGVLRDSGVVASLELAWKPTPDIVLGIEGGGVFAQELEFLDNTGSGISNTDTDSAFFVGVRASISF